MRLLLIVAAFLALTAPAGAEVVDAQPNGFTVRQTVTVDAPAGRVYRALLEPKRWWSSDHTYSGDAANLSLDTRAGGCWCEKTPGGHVRHMSVVYVDRGKEIRLFGGLGPLQQTGASGHLTYTVAEKDGRTTITWTYAVGGYIQGGATAFAAPVDQVMTEQIGRLKAYLETGRPG